MNRRAWILLLTLSAIWGASYMLIKIGIRDLSPAMVAWSRLALAALVLVALAAARGALGGFSGRVGTLVLIAAIQVAGPFLLISAGEQEISSSLAGILITSAPLFTAVLAIWIDDEERSQGGRLGGVLLGLLGVAVLLGLDLGGSGGELAGGLAVLLAGFGYAVGGLLTKRRLSELPPIGVAAWIVVAATVLLAPAALLSAPSETPGIGPVAAVTVLGVIGTGLAFAILYHLFASIGPARTWLVSYLAPGFAVVYGAVLLDEAITVATVVGMVLIVAGSWLAAGGGLRVGRMAPLAGEPGSGSGKNHGRRAYAGAVPRLEEKR